MHQTRKIHKNCIETADKKNWRIMKCKNKWKEIHRRFVAPIKENATWLMYKKTTVNNMKANKSYNRYEKLADDIYMIENDNRFVE